MSRHVVGVDVDSLRAVVHERFRSAREMMGLTQGQLAGELGLAGRDAVSNFESGAHLPCLESLVRMAEITGRSLDYFVGRSAT